MSSVTESANRVTALVIGGCYLAIGALGFIVTSSVPFTDPIGSLLVGVVALNSLQNIVHLALGAALLVAALAGRTAARIATRVVGTMLLLLGIAGLFLASRDYNAFAVNAAANLLHFASAATLLAVGLGTDRAPSRRA